MKSKYLQMFGGCFIALVSFSSVPQSSIAQDAGASLSQLDFDSQIKRRRAASQNSASRSIGASRVRSGASRISVSSPAINRARINPNVKVQDTGVISVYNTSQLSAQFQENTTTSENITVVNDSLVGTSTRLQVPTANTIQTPKSPTANPK